MSEEISDTWQLGTEPEVHDLMAGHGFAPLGTMGLGVWGVGFWGLGFGVLGFWGLGFRV